MTRPTRPPFLLLALGVLLLALPVLGEGKEKRKAAPQGFDPAAMEEAWNKARTPGEPHQFLARLEGEWTYSNKMWINIVDSPHYSIIQ